MSDNAPSSHALLVSKLSHSAPTAFRIAPEPQALEDIKTRFDLLGLRKLSFQGSIAPDGRKDWILTGHLGATVVQPCVATLNPVTTRIETDVVRRYVKTFELSDDPESEMPEDDSMEPLGSHIDPWVAMEEALSLALPLYPRADDADIVSLQATEPGKTAMTDEDTKPFAGLADLRRRMDEGGDGEAD